MTSIPICGPCHTQYLAGSPLTNPVVAGQVLHHRPTPRGLYHFFESTSWSIALSSVNSATNCFSRVFSSCSTTTQERPNASKVSAASLRRTVIQRFGVNQNSTEARYALELGPHGQQKFTVIAVDPASTPEDHSPKWISHDLIYESESCAIDSP